MGNNELERKNIKEIQRSTILPQNRVGRDAQTALNLTTNIHGGGAI